MTSVPREPDERPEPAPSMRAGGLHAVDPATLVTLAGKLREARTAVARHRHGPVGSDAASSSRRIMLRALEDYIGALETLRLPVPYALRDELRLHQRLFDR